MQKSRTFLPMLIPTVTVFISSGCIMVIELVASRLIARHLGSSLYTWTSVIGVVLAGITIGNYIGGRVADKFQPRKSLAILFVLASIACVAIVALTNVIGDWLWLWKLSWPGHVFTHIALVFLLPSVLLGTISPVVAKMALDKGLATGRTVGDIYAWGAAGSIAGTFLAGFYLIAAMGTIAIIWSVAVILAVMAILYRAKFWPLYIWVIILVVLIFVVFSGMAKAADIATRFALKEKHDPTILYEDETQYCYVAVKQTSREPDKRVFLQDTLTHSKILMDDITDLQYFYTRVYAGITHGLAGDKEKPATLSIGGGGYALPQYLKHFWPDSRVDVVEIDPRVTEAAMEGFGLPRDTTINTITMDARNYVDGLLYKQHRGEEIPKYDFIYEDAFSDYNVPFQLVTKEFNEEIFAILTDDGVYMINMIDIFDSGLFLGAMVNTLNETFPYVYVIAKDMPRMIRNTFILVVSKQELDIAKFMRSYKSEDLELWILSEQELAELESKSAGLVITDDYAPVENLLTPVVCAHAEDMLAIKYIDRAEQAKKSADYAESIKNYLKAIEADHTVTINTLSEIALIQAETGKLNEAVANLKKAIAYNDNLEKKGNIASIYYNLGTALLRLGNNDEAKGQFLIAIEQFGKELSEDKSLDLSWSRLGNSYASIGDFKAATGAFVKAFSLSPGNKGYFDDLIAALEYQGRYEEAIGILKRQIEGMTRAGQTGYVPNLEQQIKRLEYRMSQQKQK